MNDPKAAIPVGLALATAAVRGGTHLLLNEACARIALESLDGMRRSGRIRLYGFVLLPCRLEFLCRPVGADLDALLRQFDRHTSARMLAVLRRRGRTVLLQHLHQAGARNEAEASVWGKVASRPIPDAAHAERELARLHRLPAASPWNLAAAPGDYAYSSAGFYLDGRFTAIPVEDLRAEVARKDETGRAAEFR